MVETTTIVMMIGLATLIIERGFSFMKKVKRSECCKVELKSATPSSNQRREKEKSIIIQS
jgi:hypothetical protein